MSGFRQVLEQIRRESDTNKELGDRFERLMVQYFKKDKKRGLEDVRLWSKSQDLGIDIVARDKYGEQWAIQCKCYKDDATLDYEGNVTNLWVEAEAEKIPNKIIVTTAVPSANLDKQCRRTGTQIVRYADLESSGIEWDADPRKIRACEPRQLRDHQKEALKDCLSGFHDHNRGQLIMACGTGKTLTALHIVEKQAGKGGLVLYLVPSISLVKQSMQEWSDNANIRHQYMIVCSDGTVKGREDISVTDLAGAVTTNPDVLKGQYRKTDGNAMRVVFSTYQSAGVVQQAFAGITFDMIIFDEAHRTAGNEGKSFGLAHHDGNILAKTRLYMTATPRAYKREGVTEGYSMDDERIFGKQFHNLKFSKAISEGILSDYKVVGLSVVADDLDKARADAGENAEFTLEEECKLASIYGAIRQQEEGQDPNLLRRVLVFHNKIPQSKRFEMAFPKIVKRVNGRAGGPAVEVRHVDGQSRARDRSETIGWLKWDDISGAEPDSAGAAGPDVRVVSNVRCLSEGVDVPALDGVVFCEPRQSVVDVIQAVGRVMRRTTGKSEGYVIVPVVVSRNEAIESVIDRDKSNRLILQIAEALRAHDDRIDRFFNQAALFPDTGPGGDGSVPGPIIPPQIAEIFDVLPATLLDTGFYWDEYGRKLGEKAAVVAMQARNRSETAYRDTISELHESLKGAVGDTVTRNDTIDAVAQHLVLRPVFETLFGRSENPVWRAFDHVVDRLDFRAELEELDEWHKLMKYHVENIANPQAKQTVIAKIYGNFFVGFDKRQAKTIVYTPVEIVDFIIHSVQYVLRTQFDTGFDGAVRVLDPFAGTGIFLARLLESGYLGLDEAAMSFGENKLLAYYTACANLETTHEKLTGERVSFTNGSYVDTFTIPPDWRKLKVEGRVGETGEQVKLDDLLFRQVRDMRDRQRDAHIHVIMANPPYSGGRKSASEDNPNIHHPTLERRIARTYIARSPVKNTKWLYNSYIKALRWTSDRIGESGVIGFIMPSAWIVGNAEAGIRACIAKEFTDVYCLDLRGDVKKANWRKEGDKIFGGGSTVGVAITILVRDPAKAGCTIHYHDIGDYLSREQKLGKVKRMGDISNISWGEPIRPDKYHDWLNQRGELSMEWDGMIPIGTSKKNGKGESAQEAHSLFGSFSNGLVSARDDWVYNASYEDLEKNMMRTIRHCAAQNLDNFDQDAKQVTWTPDLQAKIKKLAKPPEFDRTYIRTALYRPFIKHYLYFDTTFIDRKRSIPSFYPHGDSKNISITVPDKIKGEFSAMITDTTPDMHIHEASQVFPLKVKQNRENIRPAAVSDSTLPLAVSAGGGVTNLYPRTWR